MNNLQPKTLLAVVTLLLCVSAASAQSTVSCVKPGKPDLKFAPKTMAGYFVADAGYYNLTFFADKLTDAELRYWAATESDGFKGMFEGKEHQSDPAKEKRNDALKARSVQLWGDLGDHSKHKAGSRPAAHGMDDFEDIRLSACSNYGWLNAGFSGDAIKEAFRTYSVPTPMGAATGAVAKVDFSYNDGKPGDGKPGDAQTAIRLVGDVPMFVVHQSRKD